MELYFTCLMESYGIDDGVDKLLEVLNKVEAASTADQLQKRDENMQLEAVAEVPVDGDGWFRKAFGVLMRPWRKTDVAKSEAPSSIHP